MSFSRALIEKQIIDGCLANDRSSQKMLFERYKDAMYTIVFRIIRDEDLACDALQEGFIRVFSGLAGYKYKSTLGAWIKTVMVRSAIHTIETHIQFADYETECAEKVIEWDDGLTGELLDKAIAALSPGYRSVFLLVEVEGYAHKEVAEMLNISVGTSKSQLSRAKILLQQKLKELMK
jgi:RNA polymerase sigma factor (sigma-70 family)